MIDQEAIEERASIIEHETGIPHDWAEGLAKICTMPRPPDIPPKNWDAIIHAASLLVDRWARVAHDRGWTAAEVFGCHSNAPMRRYDAMGLLMALSDPGTTLMKITEDVAIFEAGPDRIRQVKQRKLIHTNEQRMLWEKAA